MDAPFTGTLHGDGHTISNLFIDRGDEDYMGLFGYIEGATIQNVHLIDANISGNFDVGSLAGQSDRNSSISYCSATGEVTSENERVGGLVGYNYGAINNSYATCDVVGGGSTDTGGLVGWNYGTIDNCYATGSVSGNDYVGGLVGDNTGTVNRCYSAGEVDGDYSLGGLIGGYGKTYNSYYDREISGRNDDKATPKSTLAMKFEDIYRLGF